MHVSVLIRILSIGFLIGVFFASVFLDAPWFSDSVRFVWYFLIALSGIFFLIRAPQYRNVTLMLLACCFGFWYMSWRAEFVAVEPLPQQSVDVYGEVLFVDPSITRQRLTVVVEKPAELNDTRLFVYGRRYPPISVGAALSFSCQLQKAEPLDGFAYDKYVARKNIDYLCFYPAISVHAERQGFRAYVFHIKDFYAQQFNQAMHEPESSILQAMVLARSGVIPQQIRSVFAQNGISHIIAISGLHISLIAVIINMMLTGFGLSVRTRFTMSVAILGMYLLLLGFPSSAVRAATMVSVVLAGRLIGRPVNGVHILIIVAALMVLVNPYSLLFDIGFQLSFLALLGIMVTLPFWERVFFFIPDKAKLRSIVALTFAAQTFTWPLTTYHFEVISLVAPVMNAVIIPFLAPLLILAFLMPLTAMSAVLQSFLSWPLYFLLHGIVSFATVVSELPYAAVFVRSFSSVHLIW